MKETKFIEQNASKWAKFETILDKKNGDSDEISRLFMEITDDLSYARTFYPNRSVRVYLNGVAQKVFNSIYKNRAAKRGNLLNFWGQEMPQTIYEARRELGLSFGIFLVSILIGVVSSIFSPEFPVLILGQDYVEMTYRNIEAGQPMSVYQQANETDMFLHIAYNNVRVAFQTFFMGIMMGIGTLYILLFNGIMIGAFQTLFIQEGVYLDSIFTIWVHGTLEVSTIILAGAAGLALGRGLLFPKTLTRLQSLQLGARRGLKIMLTVLPLVILAAFIEGFLTRYTEAPYVLRGLIILGSLSFVLWYFVWLPFRLGQRSEARDEADNLQLLPSLSTEVKLKTIKSVGELFSEAFVVYRKFFKPIVLLSFFGALFYTLLLVDDDGLFHFDLRLDRDWIDNISYIFFNSFQFIFQHRSSSDLIFWGHVLLWTLVGGHGFYRVQSLDSAARAWSWFGVLQAGLISLVAMVLIQWLSWFFDDFSVFMMWLVCPFFLLLGAAVFARRNLFLGALAEAAGLFLSKNFLRIAGVHGLVGLMGVLFMLFTTAPLIQFLFSSLLSIFPVDNVGLRLFEQGFYVFINLFSVGLILHLLCVGVALSYFASVQVVRAEDLFEEIPKLGLRKRSYGMERE